MEGSNRRHSQRVHNVHTYIRELMILRPRWSRSIETKGRQNDYWVEDDAESTVYTLPILVL
jgi:hypothetical protein